MNRSSIRYTFCDALFHCPIQCEHSLIRSRLNLNDLNGCLDTTKDTTKAKFIKYFNDKTVVFGNQIITGLLLLRKHGCKHSDSRLHNLGKSTSQSFSDFKLYVGVKLR